METYKGMVGVVASERNKAWIEGALKNRSVRSMEAGGALLKPALSDLQRIAALTVVVDDDLLTEPQAAEALCEWAKNHGAPRQRIIVFSNSSRDADDPYFYRLVSDCDITDIFLAQLSGDPAAALDKLIDEPLSPMEYEQWKTHDPRIWEEKPAGLFGGLFGGGKKDKKKDKKEKKEKGKKKGKKGLPKKGEEAVEGLEEDGLGNDGLNDETDSVSDLGSQSGVADELPANDLPGAELPGSDGPDEDEEPMEPNGQGLVRRAGKKDKKKDKKKGGLFGGKGSADDEPGDVDEPVDDMEDEGLASNGLPMPGSSDEPAEAGSLYGDLPDLDGDGDAEDVLGGRSSQGSDRRDGVAEADEVKGDAENGSAADADDVPVDLYGIGDIEDEAGNASAADADNGVADAGSLYGLGEKDGAGVAGGCADTGVAVGGDGLEGDNGVAGAAGVEGADGSGAAGGRSSQGSDRRDGGVDAGHAGVGASGVGFGAGAGGAGAFGGAGLGAEEVEDVFDKTAVMPALSMQGTAAMPVVGAGASGPMAAVGGSGAFPVVGASGPMPVVGASVSGQMPTVAASVSGQMPAISPSDSGRMMAVAAVAAAAEKAATTDEPTKMDLSDPDTVAGLWEYALEIMESIDAGVVKLFKNATARPAAVGNGVVIEFPVSDKFCLLKVSNPESVGGLTLVEGLKLAAEGTVEHSLVLAAGEVEDPKGELAEESADAAGAEAAEKRDGAGEIQNPVKGADAEDASAADADKGAEDADDVQGLGKKDGAGVAGGEADTGSAVGSDVEGGDGSGAADGRSSQGSDRREGGAGAGHVEADAGNAEGAVGGEDASGAEDAGEAVEVVEDPKGDIGVAAVGAVGSEAVDARDAEGETIANPISHEAKDGKEAPGHDKEEEPMAKEAKETINETQAKGGATAADPKAELAKESAEKAGGEAVERRDAEGAQGAGLGKKRNRNRKRNKGPRDERPAMTAPEHASKGTFEISFPDDEAYEPVVSAPSALAPSMPAAETFDLVDMIARGTQSLTLPTGGSVVSIASIRPGIGCTHTAVACGVSAAELGVAACVALRTRASLNAMARGLADCMAINGGHGIRWRGCDFYAWDEQRKYANDYEVCFADCGVLDPRDTGKNSPANLFMNHSKVKCLLASGAPWDLRLLADLLQTIDRREVASWTIGMCSMDDDTENLVRSIIGAVATEGTWRTWRQPFSPNVYISDDNVPIRGIAAFAELMDPALPSALRPRVQADAAAASAKGRKNGKKGKKKHHKGNGSDNAPAAEDGTASAGRDSAAKGEEPKAAPKAEDPKTEADGKNPEMDNKPEQGMKPEAGGTDAKDGTGSEPSADVAIEGSEPIV